MKKQARLPVAIFPVGIHASLDLIQLRLAVVPDRTGETPVKRRRCGDAQASFAPKFGIARDCVLSLCYPVLGDSRESSRTPTMHHATELIL